MHSTTTNQARNFYLFPLRYYIYLIIAASYFLFMATHSPLGLEWRPYHATRVVNAISNILSPSVFLKLGFTSWHDPALINNPNLSLDGLSVYLVPFYHYLHYALLYILSGEDLFKITGPLLDSLIITSTSVLVAEASISSIRPLGNLNINSIGISAFTIFLTSPWVYRMSLAPWQEVYFLTFFLLSLKLFSSSRTKYALFFYFLACFSHYQWAFFLSFFYLIILAISYWKGRKSIAFNLFPSSTNNIQISRAIIILGLAATSINVALSSLATYLNPTYSIINTSVLARIGISNLHNIHHGGWLSALQFLGGNRLSLCLSKAPSGLNLSSMIDLNIFSFNCILSISGLTLLSLLSLSGLYLVLQYSETSRRLVFPLLYSFFLFATLFQQSFAAHTQGYSFIFAFFFTVGILGLLQFILKRYSPKYLTDLFILPFTLAIVISSIRVSYLTGING